MFSKLSLYSLQMPNLPIHVTRQALSLNTINLTIVPVGLVYHGHQLSITPIPTPLLHM